MFSLSLLRVILLAAMWGPSFLLIKIGLQELPPITLSFLRFLGASLFLITLFAIKRKAIFPKFGPIWGHLAMMGVFSAGLPVTLICLGEQYIDSALAGIVNGFTPLVTVLLAHFFLAEETLTSRRLSGIGLGFVGFLLLLLPSLISKGIHVDVYGMLLVGVAAVSYAVGLIYGRRYVRGLPGLSAATLQLSWATIILLPFALFLETPWQLPMLTTTTWLVMATLSIWGTALSFMLYFVVLKHDGAVMLSTSIFLLPVFSIVLGIVFLQEQLHWYVYLATLCILLGMALVSQWRFSFFRKKEVLAT